MAKSLPCTGCPEDFQLTEKTIARIGRDHPTVDIEKTLDKFVLNAEAKGWMYRNWQSAFVNYVGNGNMYGGIFYKQGNAQDPKWIPLLAEARSYGFREPTALEPTPGTYRTALESFKRSAKRATILPFENVLRVMK